MDQVDDVLTTDDRITAFRFLRDGGHFPSLGYEVASGLADIVMSDKLAMLRMFDRPDDAADVREQLMAPYVDGIARSALASAVDDGSRYSSGLSARNLARRVALATGDAGTFSSDPFVRRKAAEASAGYFYA